MHALGEGCLLYEVQQTSDITFRVYDWDRLGLDGKPRPLHVTESMATIDFSRSDYGPHAPEPWRPLPAPGCEERGLIECPYFALREQRVRGTLEQPVGDTCVVVTCAAHPRRRRHLARGNSLGQRRPAGGNAPVLDASGFQARKGESMARGGSASAAR